MSVTSTSTSTLIEAAVSTAFAVVSATEVVREAARFMPSEMATARTGRDIAVEQFRCVLTDGEVLDAIGAETAAALRIAAFSGEFDAVAAIASELRA